MKCSFLLIVLFVPFLYPQQEYNFNNYSASVRGKSLEVKKEGKFAFIMEFSDPQEYIADFDNDGLEDLMIVNRYKSGDRFDYTAYLFNTIDSFYIADSIHSGCYEPFFTVSDEIGEIIIIAGNSEFSKLTAGIEQFLPVNCYKYESGEIMKINDELYDIFISENEDILEYIEDFFSNHDKNCGSTMQIIPAVASAYANYCNAGEPTLAHQLISNYYYCDDKEEFVSRLNELILK